MRIGLYAGAIAFVFVAMEQNEVQAVRITQEEDNLSQTDSSSMTEDKHAPDWFKNALNRASNNS